MLTQTPITDIATLREHLTFNRTLLLYFKDSRMPANIITVRGNSVYVQHAGRFFWQRIGNKNIDKIVLSEFKSEVV